MTYDEERELLKLARENNALLKYIVQVVHKDEANDFITNIVANIVGNRLDGGRRR